MSTSELVIDDVVAFFNPETFTTNMHILNDIVTAERIEDLEGADMVMYQHIKTPMIVSNRCSFALMWVIDTRAEDGTFISMSTSKGTEAILEANQAKVKKDVPSDTPITFTMCKDMGNGTLQFKEVICVDPMGSLPQMIKNKIATSNAEGLKKMIRHLIKQKASAK